MNPLTKYYDIHSAYLSTLDDIYFHYDYLSSPRGFPIREKVDYNFTIINPIAESIVTHDEVRNKVIADYTSKEVELYNSLTNNVKDFAKASKFWEKLANPDGTVNSAYGYLIWGNKSHGNVFYERITNSKETPVMRTPWEWCVLSLKQDKDTRQAMLRFSLPEHQYIGNKDQTCTLHANFLIRDNKLNLSVVMRSNDLVLGLVYDLPWFVSLMDKMVDELKDTYPELTKGNYSHFVHSLHIYERDEEKVLKMLGHK